MKNRFLVLVAIIFLLGRCEVIHESGRVVGVSDGDSFTILDHNKQEVRVRLYGIDAPEKNQAFGNVSKKYLSDLIYGKQISLTEIDRDQYGRIVAIAEVGTLVVNESMLEAGLAWHYMQYDHNPMWMALQETAQLQRKGLWVDKNPTAPWTFRKNKRKVKRD